MTQNQLSYTAAASIEAARFVDILPNGHRSKALHGHSFGVRIRTALGNGWAPYVGGEVDALQFELEQSVSPLDYSLLNDRLPILPMKTLRDGLRRGLRCLPLVW